ncbi:hypothetical protein [Devosia sp. SD17-2]|uniref:hypothetical protein n=1 Tax=Devosia sp. SD17-2 TaxID=2976459 RepID=UPI0023D7F7CA|nr:hypothetical protein [Devosia sp. SD17-2]WEJ33865.1 hypothetical protein NYQ88_03360 [Devosia sp. SD17-2]
MEKQTYEVAQDVSWVNGQPVPKNRRVELTQSEALYDLGLGRITLAKPATAKVKDEA